MLLSLIRRAGTIALLAGLVFVGSRIQAQGQFGAPSANSAFSIPQAQLIQPADLNRMLTAKTGDKPLVLQVGSRVLFQQAHIVGSEYTGPGSQPEGLDQLKKRVSSLPKNKLIVLYCGCCPWGRCPNVAPAYKLLQSMSYTNVKVLYIANNFGSDWVEKGYAVEGGH